MAGKLEAELAETGAPRPLRPLVALLLLTASLIQPPAGLSQPLPASKTCPPASSIGELPLPGISPLQPALVNPDDQEPQGDYRTQLSTTPLGWPRLNHWCVWLEPVNSPEPAALWERRWLQACLRALKQWQGLLSIEQVDDPAAAQIRILRRRPPRQPGSDGRLRASHGRASLELLEVSRNGLKRPEPSVDVLISPGQRPLAIEATALHEIGHAVGLWGHSDRAEDALAAVPGSKPVLELSRRDRATLSWLYSQPSRFASDSQAGQGSQQHGQ